MKRSGIDVGNRGPVERLWEGGVCKCHGGVGRGSTADRWGLTRLAEVNCSTARMNWLLWVRAVTGVPRGTKAGCRNSKGEALQVGNVEMQSLSPVELDDGSGDDND